VPKVWSGSPAAPRAICLAPTNTSSIITEIANARESGHGIQTRLEIDPIVSCLISYLENIFSSFALIDSCGAFAVALSKGSMQLSYW
jgi:hypothetical protein